MEQNKVRTYLLYAVGEIALVMIGILLALQVNNWNEDRKNRALEKEYYCRFLENINQDEILLNEFISQTNFRLVAANEYVRLLQQEAPLKLDVGLKLFDVVKGSTVQFESNKNAYLDLASGSNLNILKDILIKEALNNYYKKVEGYTEIAKLNNEFVVETTRNSNELYENGWLHARSKNNRFLEGMDEDVYAGMNISFDEVIMPSLKDSLKASGYRFISIIYRRTELYNLIYQEIDYMKKILSPKCEEIQ